MNFDMKFQPLTMQSDYFHKVLSGLNVSNKLEFPIQVLCPPVDHPQRGRNYHPPQAKHRENLQSLVKFLINGLSHMILKHLVFFKPSS